MEVGKKVYSQKVNTHVVNCVTYQLVIYLQHLQLNICFRRYLLYPRIQNPPYSKLHTDIHRSTPNSLAAEFFFATLQGALGYFLYIPSSGTKFFLMFTVWCRLFFLILKFPRLRIEALPLSTVQGKCVYTIFQAESQEIQFPLLCSKPRKDEH